MKKKQPIRDLFQQNYQQFIQYLNDVSFPPLLNALIMYIPSITIFGDLLQNIYEQSFLHLFTNLTPAQLFIQLSIGIDWLLIFIKILFLMALFMPVLVIGMVVIITFISSCQHQVEISYFYHMYNNSGICKIIRLYFGLYQHAFYPFLTSFGIKLAIYSTKSDITVGVLLIIFAFINSIVFHYYTIQIPNDKTHQSQYQLINFPNVFIESVLILVTIIIINVTNGFAPYVCCLSFYVLRTITGYFLRFYAPQIYYQHFFKLLFCCSISLGMLIGYINKQFSESFIFVCLSLVILIKIKFSYRQKYKNYIQVQTNLQQSQFSIQHVKYYLKHQKIAKAFEGAVFTSRKKNSHRDGLIIDILKRKCYHLESQSRGSTKMANSLQLLQYQIRIVKIVKNIVLIQQQAVQALSIMKSKQLKQQMLIKNVVKLVDHINENKKQFIECIKINSMAVQLNILMRLFFKDLYNDGVFLRQIYTSLQDQGIKLNHKRIQKQLFSKDKALIVVKVIDQIGKISKVSNNFYNLLGYSSHSLIGLSINQLIPISIRQVHDQILNNFINNFTSQVIREKHFIQFYAYDKQFHLQKVEIKYKFFLHNFETCQLSSIFRKLKTQEYVILTDQFGNIQGWTAKIGDIFNFDQLTGNDCNAYNILPLMPSIIKFDNRSSLSLRTMFFRLSKMKNPKLMLYNGKRQKFNIEEFKKKQLQVFFDLLEKSDIIEGFSVKIEIDVKYISNFDKIMRVIKFVELKRIQNMESLENAILQNSLDKNNEVIQQKFDFNPNYITDKCFQQSQDADFSIFKNTQKIAQTYDFNFTLDLKKDNVFQFTDLKLCKDIEKFQSSIFSSRSLLKIDTQQNKEQFNSLTDNMTVQSNFNPKLQRKNNFVQFVIFTALAILALIIFEQINFTYVFQQMTANKSEIFNANRAEMIYCKSVFNPNQTYIKQFNSGQLLITNSWLYEQNTTYITSAGQSIVQNQFYLFNIQIPSNLDRIIDYADTPNIYQIEQSRNFYNVISLYEKNYNNYIEQWSNYIDDIKAQCAYIMIAYTIAAIIYIVFLGFIEKRYKNQRKMMEAFFKFEKVDLDTKISSINSLVKSLHRKCQDWFISQYLNESKKGTIKQKRQNQAQKFGSLRKQNNNSQLQVGLQKNQSKQLDGLQAKIVKTRFYCVVGIAVVIISTQLLFLILHRVLVSNMLNSYKQIINKYDQANKLIVYPNLKMANTFYPASTDLITQYENSVKQTLDQPIYYMPDLFSLLQQPPCRNCTFLPQILNTNYRSFYSYFMQVMSTFNIQTTNITELFYAVDVVTQNIAKSLNTETVNNPTLLILLYIFSLAIFFGSVFYITRLLNQECLKLQCFLKFFDLQTLLKNKHMSTIMAKNT